jgi:hypothetical protein
VPSGQGGNVAAMDGDALHRAQERLEAAAAARVVPADVDATLERARDQVAALAATTAELEASMPGRVGDAVKDGIRTEVLPVARHIAEVRGLLNQLIRRIEGIEGDLLSERHARVDDLSLLVDLIAAGFQGVEQRLDRIEAKLGGDLVALPLAS